MDANLGLRGLIASLALVAILLKVYAFKYQAKHFNACIEEIINITKSVPSVVDFCNGGN